jgi:hypothetical protein
MTDAPITVHILNRLRRRRSTQWYLDRSERKTSTLCGAAVTQFDLNINWKVPDGVYPLTERGVLLADGTFAPDITREYVVCGICRLARDLDRANRKQALAKRKQQ